MLLRVFYCEKHAWYINVWCINVWYINKYLLFSQILIFKTRVNILWIGYCHGKSLVYCYICDFLFCYKFHMLFNLISSIFWFCCFLLIHVTWHCILNTMLCSNWYGNIIQTFVAFFKKHSFLCLLCDIKLYFITHVHVLD